MNVSTRIVARVALTALVLSGCANDTVATDVSTPFTEELEPAAWQTVRAPYVLGDGAIYVYFTRPGISKETGEDPEVDDDIAALFAGAEDRIDLCLFEFNRQVINEVLPNPAGADGPHEFVEIVNAGSAGINLTGWRLGDRLSPERHVFDSLWLPPGAGVVVYSGADPTGADPDRIVASSGSLSLNNNAEDLSLYSADGTVVDATAWKNAPSGVSFNRVTDGASDGGFVLHETLSDTLDNSPGTDAAGVPWSTSVVIPDIAINELLPNPDGPDKDQEYVELVVLADSPIDISGWTLSDAISVRHVFAEGTVVEPGQTVVVFSGEAHDEVPNVRLASTGALGLSNTGDTVVLRTADGVQVDAVAWTKSTSGVALNRTADGGAVSELVPHTELGGLMSPGLKANGNFWTPVASTNVVVINEALPNPAGADTGEEFVELVNPSAWAVGLNGWTLSDAVKERHVFGPGEFIPAGGVMVVFDSGLHDDIPGALVASTGALSLNNTEETITLTNHEDAVISEATWSAATEGVSFNRAIDADPASAWVLHDTLSDLPLSPGTRADGLPW